MEALETLLSMKFETTVNAQEILLEETKTFFNLLSKKTNNENLRNVSANPQCQRLYNACMSFKDEVRKGSLGKTPQFWINYMDIVWTILKFIKATLLNCIHAAGSTVQSRSTIIVRSPDTDVLLLLVKFAINLENDIIFDTGTGSKRRLLIVNRIITDQGPETCAFLPAFLAFTGCDTTSACVRRGKAGPLKLLKKHQEYITAFKTIGEDINITDTTINTLKKFVCCNVWQTEICKC